MTVAESVPSATHGKQYAVHFVPLERHDAARVRGSSEPAPAAEEATFHTMLPAHAGDVDDVVRTALGLPRVLETLRRDLTAVVIVTGALGVFNAIVVIAALRRRRTRSRASSLRFVERPAFAFATSAMPSVEPFVVPPMTRAIDVPSEPAHATRGESRRCACGATISERSRTGRCRRCARLAQAASSPDGAASPKTPSKTVASSKATPKRPASRSAVSQKVASRKSMAHEAASHADTISKTVLPLTLTIAASTDPQDEPQTETARAVLTSSRVGRQTEYYSVIR